MADNNQKPQKEYTVEIDDNGMLESVLVEEVDGIGRWMYKRNPKGMELRLTDAIFEETVEASLYNGIFVADEMYENLRMNDEYYANLMKKFYKQYLLRYVFESSLHQDAFWGE